MGLAEKKKESDEDLLYSLSSIQQYEQSSLSRFMQDAQRVLAIEKDLEKIGDSDIDASLMREKKASGNPIGDLQKISSDHDKFSKDLKQLYSTPLKDMDHIARMPVAFLDRFFSEFEKKCTDTTLKHYNMSLLDYCRRKYNLILKSFSDMSPVRPREAIQPITQHKSRILQQIDHVIETFPLGMNSVDDLKRRSYQFRIYFDWMLEQCHEYSILCRKIIYIVDDLI